MSLKQAELKHTKRVDLKRFQNPPTRPKPPKKKKTAEELAKAQTEIADLSGKISPLKSERTSLVAKVALLERLNGHLDNLENSYASSFVEQTEPEFTQAGLTLSNVVTPTLTAAH